MAIFAHKTKEGMSVFIFVSNINTEYDVNRVKPVLNNNQAIINWSIDLSDEEKVLRVVTNEFQQHELISLVNECGYECHGMDW